MKNKTVVRKPNQVGAFTTVHHSILFDTRISGLEFRILTIILSDSDNFNLTQSLLINRLKVDKKTLQKAFKNLEECGYLRRKKMARGHYYTISEFGNLADDRAGQLMVIEESNKVIPEIEPVLENDVVEKLCFEDYKGLIAKLIPSSLNDDILVDVWSYFIDNIGDGTLCSHKQMSEENITKIIKTFIPSPPSRTEINRNINEICEAHAGGRGITIANKKEITAKTIKYFTDNPDVKPTEKTIRNRILLYKTSYTSAGHLDQKYQN